MRQDSYGCDTWLVTNEVMYKLQIYVNSCYMQILWIWWNGNLGGWSSNEKLLRKADKQNIKCGWIGHALRKKNYRKNVNAGV